VQRIAEGLEVSKLQDGRVSMGGEHQSLQSDEARHRHFEYSLSLLVALIN